MSRIEIPFHLKFKEAMLSGRKTVTSRTKKCGDIDDWFEVFGAKFQIILVFEATLQQVCILGWYAEGLNSPREFADVWNEMHPVKGYVPSQIMYVHYFKELKNES